MRCYPASQTLAVITKNMNITSKKAELEKSS